MKIILFLAANITVLLSGADVISKSWLIATFVIDYVRAIFSESDVAPEGNFRKLSDRDFDKSEANIKIATFKNLIVSALFFGLALTLSHLGWI